MMHLAAYYQSVDPAGAYVSLAALADSQITVNTPRIQVPPLNQIILAAAGVENTVAPLARLVAPSLTRRWRHQLSPVNVAAAAAVLPMSPARLVDLRDDPLVMVPSEQLSFEINSNPAAAQIQWGLVWFAEGKPAPLSAPTTTARATVANALVAGVWTLNTLTFDEQLPRGRYAIAGFRPMSTTLIAARLVIPSLSYRPGALGVANISDVSSDIFRYGNLGSWGEFEDIDNLQIESLAAAADAAAVQHYLVDLVQLREGPG
jgi:hypothetical protein